MLTVIPQFKHYQVVRPCRYNDKKHCNLIVQANGFLESCYRHKANHEHPATKSKAKVAEAPGVTHKMKVGFSLGADLPRKYASAELGRPGKQDVTMYIQKTWPSK